MLEQASCILRHNSHSERSTKGEGYLKLKNVVNVNNVWGTLLFIVLNVFTVSHSSLKRTSCDRELMTPSFPQPSDVSLGIILSTQLAAGCKIAETEKSISEFSLG